MSRQRLQCLAGIITVVIGSAASAAAQHYHGPGHYDYHPGQYIPHGGHYHYQPGHYDYHGPTYSQPRPIYTQPRPTYVQPQQSYVSPPRTSYYQGADHSHEHAGNHLPARVTYGGFSHVDDIAATLEAQANDLCLELHYNYQHNPGFRQTYREAYEILTTAKYIHGLEHSGNRDKVRQAVSELDGLFHHVQSDVAGWTGHHHRPVGHGGLTSKLEAVQETLHHLMDDVGVRPARSGHGRTEQAPSAEFSPSVPFGDFTPHQGAAPYRGAAPGDQGAAPYRGAEPRGQFRSDSPQIDAAPSGDSVGPPPDDVPLVLPN